MFNSKLLVNKVTRTPLPTLPSLNTIIIIHSLHLHLTLPALLLLCITTIASTKVLVTSHLAGDVKLERQTRAKSWEGVGL